MSSRYHGSMVTIPFALSKNGRKLWATGLFLSAITHRKVIHFNFFSPYLQDHGLLTSRNIATMQSGNDVFSLFKRGLGSLSRNQISHCLANWSSRFQTKNTREI